jgi:hypothetical protein
MKITVKTKPVKPIMPVKTIHLEMTEEEAKVLFVLAGSIGGCSTTKFRSITNVWYNDLCQALDIDCDDYYKLKDKYKIIKYLEVN